MTPARLPDMFAALMLMVAAVSAARLAAARPRERGFAVTGTDVAHLFMGIAMAGMLARGLATLPYGAWEVVFALLTAWFVSLLVCDARVNGARALAGGHWSPHLIHSAAMLYMVCSLAAPAGRGGTGAMGGSSAPAMQSLAYPALALVFALVLSGYAVWDLDQLSGGRYRPARAPVVLAGAGASATPRGIPALAGAEAALATFPDAHRWPDRGGAVGIAWPPGGAASDRPGRAFLLSPGTTVGCRILMSVTMAYMLLIMI